MSVRRRRASERAPLGLFTNFSCWRSRMTHLTHVELLWLEKRIENWIRFGRAAEEKFSTSSDVSSHLRRVVYSHWYVGPQATSALSPRVSTLLGLSRLVRASRPYPMCVPAATFCCGCPAGQMLIAYCNESTLWKRSASIRLTSHRTIGITSTTACPSMKRPGRTRASRHQAWLHRRRIAP